MAGIQVELRPTFTDADQDLLKKAGRPTDDASLRFFAHEGIRQHLAALGKKDAADELADAVDHYFDRVAYGHNDGAQRLEHALSAFRDAQ